MMVDMLLSNIASPPVSYPLSQLLSARRNNMPVLFSTFRCNQLSNSRAEYHTGNQSYSNLTKILHN
jgi:hypothetical protein